MLRLRHDEDFSRALWDTGFRFVACDLDCNTDPAAAAAETSAWTSQLRSAGVLADGAGAGGGGLQILVKKFRKPYEFK